MNLAQTIIRWQATTVVRLAELLPRDSYPSDAFRSTSDVK